MAGDSLLAICAVALFACGGARRSTESAAFGALRRRPDAASIGGIDNLGVNLRRLHLLAARRWLVKVPLATRGMTATPIRIRPRQHAASCRWPSRLDALVIRRRRLTSPFLLAARATWASTDEATLRPSTARPRVFATLAVKSAVATEPSLATSGVQPGCRRTAGHQGRRRRHREYGHHLGIANRVCMHQHRQREGTS